MSASPAATRVGQPRIQLPGGMITGENPPPNAVQASSRKCLHAPTQRRPRAGSLAPAPVPRSRPSFAIRAVRPPRRPSPTLRRTWPSSAGATMGATTPPCASRWGPTQRTPRTKRPARSPTAAIAASPTPCRRRGAIASDAHRAASSPLNGPRLPSPFEATGRNSLAAWSPATVPVGTSHRPAEFRVVRVTRGIHPSTGLHANGSSSHRGRVHPRPAFGPDNP